ncbi:tetratricopeptide repeat protein [Azospirillum soli]|uniref:tetratricopeptide repeat protein n=1 Tax=Azospirillum soli TaxID=1304799 RepID=UPI001AE139B1|nr:tetratricopeptide repeat protein [Azospirillum soli]MBP2315854.1 tetratricopeptide (TPR) repeat protein [Azospirillum soli]
MATIAEALALALDHHLAGRLAEAQVLYTRVLDAEPDQPDALHFLGVLAGQLGEHAVGLQLIGRAIDQRPEAADMHANAANVLRAADRAADAVAAYRRAVALQPDFAEAWADMATALRTNGDTRRAIVALERALAAAPQLTAAQERLGPLLREHGRLLVESGLGVEALPPLARAAELLPLDADIAFLYGNALYATGLREDSLTAYRNALAITPDYPSAAFNLGIALAFVGRLDEAAAALEHTLRLDPRHGEAREKLAVTLSLLGREDEARTWAAEPETVRPAPPSRPAPRPDRRSRNARSRGRDA